jgi:hypothetical protein
MAAFLGDRPSWPVEDIQTAVRGGAEEVKGAEGTFRMLRKAVVSADSAEVEANVAHAAAIWMFLLEFAAGRKIYRRQVLEVVNALMESKAWEDAYSSNKSLEAMARTLPGDVQAAFAVQHEVIAKSFSPKEMEELRKKAQPEDSRTEVYKSLARAREAEKLHTDMLKEALEDAPEVPVAFGDDQAAKSDEARIEELCEGLRDAVEEVLDCDSPDKFEMEGIRTFGNLRRQTLFCVNYPEALEREATHAPAVLNFLIDVTKKHRLRVRQTCEVLNVLMDSPPWAAAFEASPMLIQRVQEELPDDAKVAFGLQNSKILAQMSEDTRKKASATGDGDEGMVGQAKKAAQQMDFLRKSMRRPAAAVKTAASDAAKKNASAAATAAADVAAVAEEWREAKTPEGKVYYYNVNTRASAWKLPPGAVLVGAAAAKASAAAAKAADAGGAVAAQAGAAAAGYSAERVSEASVADGAYNVRDRVEVWSNSKQVWCPGVVEQVKAGKILVAFQTPGAQADEWARKELPAEHNKEYLRKAVSRGSTQSGGQGHGGARHSQQGAAGDNSPSWTREETECYGKYWKESGAETNPNAVPAFLGRSNLHRRTLREVWNLAAGFFGSRSLGKQEFFMLCRLVGHSQQMQRDASKRPQTATLLSDGGRTLHQELKRYCNQPPPHLPRFQ